MIPGGILKARVTSRPQSKISQGNAVVAMRAHAVAIGNPTANQGKCGRENVCFRFQLYKTTSPLGC